MLSSVCFYRLLTLLIGTSALAISVDTHKYKKAELPISGRYIVRLKYGIDKQTFIQSTAQNARRSKVIYDWSIINAYAAELRAETLEQLLADDNVESVEEDGTIKLEWSRNPAMSNPAINEGADAVNLRATENGDGVDIYSVDSGVYVEHSCFGGRARFGTSFLYYPTPDPTKDGLGHGTFTMGVAAGQAPCSGVAHAASIIAVKVFSDSGLGLFSDWISGINWATESAISSGRPSIINLSWGSSPTPAIDDAVRAALAANVSVTIAAGNNNVDASSYSPCRVEEAITVGAIDDQNVKANFSDWGSVVDVWYRGVEIESADITSPDAMAVSNGTSFSAPGVAGLLAVEISKYEVYDPATLQNELKANAEAVVIGAPEGTTNLKAAF
ncbi:serine protease [Atractiella rhizophila]|nr:serine protease [Atractiella rhizophila]